MNENNIHRILQLRRSTKIYKNFDAAETALKALEGRKDGEIIVAAYADMEGDGYVDGNAQVVGSAVGVYYGSACTVLAGADLLGKFLHLVETIQEELDATQSGAGLNDDGSYTPLEQGDDGYSVIGNAESVNDAVNLIAKTVEDIDGAAHEIMSKVSEMHGTFNYTEGSSHSGITDKSVAVSAMKQDDGKVYLYGLPFKSGELDGYSNTGATCPVSDGDTIEVAISKLENTLASQSNYAVAGSDAISVSVKENNSQTVSLIVSEEEDGGLEIVEGEGLRLASVDCGSYDEEEEP